MRTHPLGFMILRVQVKEITSYDEDIVFLAVSDESEFSRCVRIVIGTCTLGRIVNVIKESEMDRISTPWAMVRDLEDLEEPVYMKENVRVGPFQTQILECRVKPLLSESTHIMVTPLRAGEAQPGGVQPLPLGLHVLHVYTRLKMSSSKVSVVVRNMLESVIFLKKGVQVVRMEAVLGRG